MQCELSGGQYVSKECLCPHFFMVFIYVQQWLFFTETFFLDFYLSSSFFSSSSCVSMQMAACTVPPCPSPSPSFSGEVLLWFQKSEMLDGWLDDGIVSLYSAMPVGGMALGKWKVKWLKP